MKDDAVKIRMIQRRQKWNGVNVKSEDKVGGEEQMEKAKMRARW